MRVVLPQVLRSAFFVFASVAFPPNGHDLVVIQTPRPRTERAANDGR